MGEGGFMPKYYLTKSVNSSNVNSRYIGGGLGVKMAVSSPYVHLNDPIYLVKALLSFGLKIL